MSSDICSLEPNRTVSDGSVRRFVSDRNIRSLHLPRRLGMEAAASIIMEAAEKEGISASLYPDVSGDTVIVLGDGTEVPGKDTVSIVYLCHQTLAAFRS